MQSGTTEDELRTTDVPTVLKLICGRYKTFEQYHAVPWSHRRYEVLTWDTDLEEFTPQDGVRKGPYTLFGLRKAIRALQKLGYDGYRNDPSILVERVR